MSGKYPEQPEILRYLNHVADRFDLRRNVQLYLGANIPGKPRVFMPYCGGVGTYRQHCDNVVANGYEGFRLGKTAPVG